MSISLIKYFTEWVFHWMSTSLIEYFTEWVFHWMSTSLVEYFTEWVLHWLITSLNEYFTGRVLHWIGTSLNEYFTEWNLHWISTCQAICCAVWKTPLHISRRSYPVKFFFTITSHFTCIYNYISKTWQIDVVYQLKLVQTTSGHTMYYNTKLNDMMALLNVVRRQAFTHLTSRSVSKVFFHYLQLLWRIWPDGYLKSACFNTPHNERFQTRLVIKYQCMYINLCCHRERLAYTYLLCFRSLKTMSKSHIIYGFFIVCFEQVPGACVERCCAVWLVRCSLA